MITLRSANHNASSWSRIALSGRIEIALVNIYRQHNLTPINDETRQRLCSIPENLAFELVSDVLSLQVGVIYNLDSFIVSKVNQAVSVTGSPRLSSGGSTTAHPRSPSGRHVCRVLDQGQYHKTLSLLVNM